MLSSHDRLAQNKRRRAASVLCSSMYTDVYVVLAKSIEIIDNVSDLPHDTHEQVLKLKQALYGLKQGPQLWNKEMHAFLFGEFGWTRADNESCLYNHHDD